MKKYMLVAGSKIMRCKTNVLRGGAWQNFVTTKDAYYSEDDILLMGKKGAFVRIPDTQKGYKQIYVPTSKLLHIVHVGPGSQITVAENKPSQITVTHEGWTGFSSTV